jgi:hypothetical protein
MSTKANIVYSAVEDRNARIAFSQVAQEITAIKRDLSGLLSSAADSGYGAASVSSAATGVTFDVRETNQGLVVLSMAFPVDLADDPSYETLLTLGNGFPKMAVAAAVSYLSAPPAAGNVSCTVLPDGNVKIGIAAGTGTLDCVATAVWKRR